MMKSQLPCPMGRSLPSFSVRFGVITFGEPINLARFGSGPMSVANYQSSGGPDRRGFPLLN
jgi:hypothetical protein